MNNGIDQTDLLIIRLLQENGRMTNVELAKQVGLSPAPTLERVRKLEKQKLIRGYHARVDEQALGIGIQALIQVSLARQKENAVQQFIRKIHKIEEIVECYQITGNFDYQLKIQVRDIPAFDRLIAEKLSKIDEIGQMHSCVILSQVKKSVSLPIDYP